MPRQTNRPILPALLGLLTITTLLYYLFLTPSSATKMTTTSDAAAAVSDPLSHLHVSLRQTSTSPPTLTARVTNTHPSTPFTLVTWDTPLDPLALKLGLATITLGDGEEELSIPTIQVRRKMPPDAGSVVVIDAGGFKEQEFVLAEPVVAVGRIRGEGGGRARVGLRGRWTRVWEGREQGQEGDEALGGDWQAGVVEVEV